MNKLGVLDLFSGIGGFSLGLERTGGFKTVAFCEIEEFPQKVLAKHWPGVPIYDDVRELTAERLRADGIIPNVITGGFPCQDISVAGNQKGMGEGTRSGLWSECARLLGEIRPDYAIFENVTALLSGDNGRWFQRVLFDISEVGYDAEWHCIPASELGAHHHRDRVWIICYTDSHGQVGMLIEGNGEGNCVGKKEKIGQSERASTRPGDVGHPQKLQRNGGDNNGENGKCVISEPGDSSGENTVANTDIPQRPRDSRPIGILAEYAKLGRASWWSTEPDVGRVANGIPERAHRLKGLGNAVVPQIPELIGYAILDAINSQQATTKAPNRGQLATCGEWCDDSSQNWNVHY